MFDRDLLDRLSGCLKEVLANSEGTWQERSRELEREMKDRDVDMDEFTSWWAEASME